MSKFEEKEYKPTILVVEDDRSTLLSLETRLQNYGYQVITAINGKLACQEIKRSHNIIDAILLDRLMPEMDGMQVVEWLRKQKKITKPSIIMQTGSDKPEQVKEGIDAGVFYYLTKPIQEPVLKSVISSAVKESRERKLLALELQGHKGSFQLMIKSVFHLQSIADAENLSRFIANCFPDPEYILQGISELLINAIEHGNLEISYDEKGELVSSGRWREEVERRIRLPQNIIKKVELVFYKEDGKYFIRISDQGKGFQWNKYIKPDAARALDNHGRGIARANMVFSKLEYNKDGNQVLAVLDPAFTRTLDW